MVGPVTGKARTKRRDRESAPAVHTTAGKCGAGTVSKQTKIPIKASPVEPNLALQFDLLSELAITVLTLELCVTEFCKQTSAGSSSEDEVEMPVLKKGGLDGERSKNENDYVDSASVASWSKIHEKLLSDEKQPLNFEGISFTKGVKIADGRILNQSNPLHFQPFHHQVVTHSGIAEEDLDSQEQPQLAESLQAVEYDSLEEAAANPVDGWQENIIHELEDSISDKAFGRHESLNHSMADLLDGLQAKKCGSHAILKRVEKKGRKRKVGVRITSLLEKRTSDDEGPCEIIDNGSSSDDLSKDKIIVLATTEPKRKTMADQFQEALGATSANKHALLLMPKQSRACSNGLLEKLQRVIQREKELDMDLMQNLRSETLADEAGHIDVKLLSRSFEAKLTVCLCSINCYKKSSMLKEKSEEEIPMHTTMTIIFTSRTCGDVELDAGTCIRVYPPWSV
ncbi:hypothetical protein V2J09_016097 [Rumex salicifolius]